MLKTFRFNNYAKTTLFAMLQDILIEEEFKNLKCADK